MKKELSEMWHKAWPDSGAFVRASAEDLERFAELVRADEREAVLDLVDAYAKNSKDLAAAIRARGNT